jgi:hypothetical protein
VTTGLAFAVKDKSCDQERDGSDSSNSATDDASLA